MEARTQTPGRRQFGRHVRLGRLSETHQKGNRRQGEEEGKKEKLSSSGALMWRRILLEFGGPLWVISGRGFGTSALPLRADMPSVRNQCPLSASSGSDIRALASSMTHLLG